MFSFYWPFIGGVSGGIIFNGFKDLYNVNNSNNFNFNSIFNYGFIGGACLGYMRYYSGKPILMYFFSLLE